MNVATEHGGAELAAALGLAIDPFAPAALPDFFFVGGRRRFLAQQTTHALYFSGSLVLLVGAAGAGKSRVLDEVCRELAPLVDICRIEATVLADAVEIRGQLAHALHLPVSAAEDNDQLLLALARLQSAAAEPLPVALIIDDAHLLGVPVLAACQQLAQASGGRLRLLLAGEQELLTAWQQLDAGADVIELPPLDRQEVADYLNTRLQAAGLRRELPLSALQLEELHRHSGGNIGALHTLLPAVMAPAAPGGARKSLLQGLPLPHIGAVAALVAVVSLALWFGGDDDDAPAAAVDAAGRRAVPLALPGLARESAGAAEQPATQGSAVVTRPLERPQTTAMVAVPLPIQRSPQAERDVADAGAHTPAPAPAPAPARAEPVAKPAAAPVPAPKPAPAPAPKPVAAKSPAPAPAPQKSVEAKPEVAKPASPAANATLLAMPANQYMVQLLAAHNKGKVDSFVAVARRTLKVHVYETRRGGKPWYVVVAGPYRDQAAARAAIAGLPKGLSEGQPWLRSVASVHADLRAGG